MDPLYPWNEGPKLVLSAFQKTKRLHLAPGLCGFSDYIAHAHLHSRVVIRVDRGNDGVKRVLS